MEGGCTSRRLPTDDIAPAGGFSLGALSAEVHAGKLACDSPLGSREVTYFSWTPGDWPTGSSRITSLPL